MSGTNGQHNWAVSIGGAAGNTVRDSDFLSVIAEVASDRYRTQVVHLREVRDAAAEEGRLGGLTGDALLDFIKDATDPIKRKIPAVLWSGTFTKRNAQCLKQHSGLIHVDLDKLGDTVEGWRDQIIQDEHTLYCMVSPSGTGLKVVYKCDPAKDHIDSFRAAEHHVLKMFGLTADPSCKDVSRLCFLSWDPDAFYNPNSTPLPYPPPAPEPDIHEPAPSPTHTGLKPGEDYDIRGDWKSVLRKHGWTDQGDHFWIRPGKTQGVSATWDLSPKHPKRLYVFTSSTPFPPDHHYRPWHIYAHLEHGGDFAKASKELYAQNYGDRIKPKPVEHEVVVWEDESSLRPLSSFTLPPDGDRSILLGDRFLSRGDGGILVGSSGMGKSSLSLQKAISWALGRHAFGVTPNGALRSLIFQSEDSDGDIAEMWESMKRSMELTPEEIGFVDDRVRVVSERVARGLLFVGAMKRAIAEFKPDLVWINPLQAFLDGDITDSQDLGRFLREQLNALNTPPAFAYFLVHHTTKPATGKDRSERLWHEVMYDMAGGAELINWARAIISLRPGAEAGDFNLHLAKRGTRAGVTRKVPQGAGFREEIVTVVPLRHATGRFTHPGVARGLPKIFWEPREPDEPRESTKTGRKEKYLYNDYRNVMPKKSDRGLEFGVLHKRLSANGEIPKSSLQGVLKRWIEEGFVEAIMEQDLAARWRAVV